MNKKVTFTIQILSIILIISMLILEFIPKSVMISELIMKPHGLETIIVGYCNYFSFQPDWRLVSFSIAIITIISLVLNAVCIANKNKKILISLIVVLIINLIANCLIISPGLNGITIYNLIIFILSIFVLIINIVIFCIQICLDRKKLDNTMVS